MSIETDTAAATLPATEPAAAAAQTDLDRKVEALEQDLDTLLDGLVTFAEESQHHPLHAARQFQEFVLQTFKADAESK